jgi:hypothetical protein
MEVSVHLTLCFIKHYRGLQSRGRRFDSDPRLIHFSLPLGPKTDDDPNCETRHFARTR